MNDSQLFNVGDQVRHRQWGDGSVANVQPSSGGTQYFVKFSKREGWLYSDNLKLVRRAMVTLVRTAR